MKLWLYNHFVWKFSQLSIFALKLVESFPVVPGHLFEIGEITDSDCEMCSHTRKMPFSGLFYLSFQCLSRSRMVDFLCPHVGVAFIIFWFLTQLLLVPLGWELQLCVPVPCVLLSSCTKHGLIFTLQWVIAIWFQVNVYLQYKCQ